MPKRNIPTSVLEDLRTAGTLMANICFNLSQREGALDARVCEEMKAAQVRWDAACARAFAAPSPGKDTP